MQAEQPATFQSRYPRAFARLRIAYVVIIVLLLAEIGTRVSTYLAYRSGLGAHPEIQRRLEQSSVFYPKMTVGVVTGDPGEFPGVIPLEDGPPKVVPFAEMPEDAFRTPIPSEPPSPGVVRIAFIGGSTTYDGYPEEVGARLQKQFGAAHVEIVNLGIPASNSGTSLIMAEHYLPRMRPQLVVVYHGFNDIVFGRARAAAQARLDSGAAGPDDPALEVMPASRGLLSLLRGSRAAAQPLDDAGLQRIADNYDAFAKLGDELGFSLWVSLFAAPSYAELDAEQRAYFEAELRYLWPVVGSVDRYAEDLGRYHARVRELAQKHGLGLIDVAAAVQGGRESFADNCHLTEAGRALHADAVAAALAPAVAALLEPQP